MRKRSAVVSVGRCLSVRPSVCHTRVLYLNGQRYQRYCQTSFSVRQPHHSSFFKVQGPLPNSKGKPLTGILKCTRWEYLRVSWCHPRHYRKEAQALPKFGVPFYFCVHLLTKFDVVIHMGRSLFFGFSTPPSQRAEPQCSPFWEFSSIYVYTL